MGFEQTAPVELRDLGVRGKRGRELAYPQAQAPKKSVWLDGCDEEPGSGCAGGGG